MESMNMNYSEQALKKLRKQIIDQIVAARTEKGITQMKLAEMLGTHRSNISRLERGDHNPSLDMLLRISSVLGIDLNIQPDKTVKQLTGVAYELRLYDTTLVSFTLEDKGIEGLVAHIINVNNKMQSVFPLDLELTDEGLLKWLERRVIPKNRTFVDEILKTLKLSVNDTKGIIDVCKGLSLNDSYWVAPKGFEGKFSGYNLYENRFSEILSLVAYTGICRSNAVFTTSPELTTNGMLPKAWRFIENDGIYLYKGGTSGFANSGNEPYSEYYACRIAEVMGLNSVHYDLENWKGILASKCKLFTDMDTSFIPIGRIVKTGGLKAVLDYYAKLGKEFFEQLRSMLVFDAVIYNEDRHFGNFGLFRDNHTGEIIAPAPIFDNGLSLFNYAMPNDIENLDEYAQTRAPAYGNVSFESICKEIIGKTQMQQLRKLIGFKFERHPQINLPEERLIAIEKHIGKRVRELLELV
jgi:transcriptional regulator with XRE-family HTH domain